MYRSFKFFCNIKMLIVIGILKDCFNCYLLLDFKIYELNVKLYRVYIIRI